MLHKRVTPTERVYEKVVEPSLGSFQAIPHTSHCCVRYQPSLRAPKSPSLSSGYTATLPQQRTLPKIQLANRLTRSAIELGRHGLLYQSNKADVSNLQRSATPNSFSSALSVPWTFHSTTRVKQVPLPQVQNHDLVRSNTPRGKRNVSVSGDRYLGTSKSREQSNSSSLHKSYPQYEATALPKREQVRRFEDEQTNLYVTRTMKRKSEILSHRVDRMYYLSGSGFPVQGRYEVNDAELQRLREFSRIRNNSRATSAHSSGRSQRGFTESNVLAESRRKRSPLGSPLGSPRCTPAPGDESIDLSVEGNSVVQEVKGPAGSNQVRLEDDRVGRMSSGSKDITLTNGDENNELCASKTDGSADEEKTSPHRTMDENNDKTDDRAREGKSGHEVRHNGEVAGRSKTNEESDSGCRDRQNEATGSGRSENSGQDGVDGQTDSTRHVANDGDDGAIDGIAKTLVTESIDGKGAEDHGGVSASGDFGDDTCENLSSQDTLKRGDGCQGDIGEIEGGGAGGGGEGGIADRRRADESKAEDDCSDTSRDMASGDAVQHDRGCHGDDNAEEGAGDVEKISQNGEEILASECVGGRLIESIAPGLNLDKTPFTMKKSDVYLTKFVDPKREHLAEMASDDDAESRVEGNENESQIASMEVKLQKVSALTQEVDDIGHMTGSDYDPSEFKVDEDDPHEGSYDGGVFARAKSDNDRLRAMQLREERKVAKSALKSEQQEAQRVREKADKERAVKQENKLKFKMEDVYNFISSRQREIFKQKFRELDVDGNGKITVKELTKKMHRNVPKNDIHHLHKVFDLNRDKTIDEREFVTVAALNDKLIGQEVSSEVAPLELNLNRLSLHITAYKEMFEVVDQNGDGRLSMDEIMLIITASTGVNIAIDKEAVRYIHNTIDKDGNGSIDFVEFLAFIPFFQKIYQEIIGKPISIEEIEEARIAVKKAMNR